MTEAQTRMLIETDHRSKSNMHRIDRLEQSTEALNDMAKSIAVMATEQKNVSNKVDKIDCKVSALEKVPADRRRSLIGYIIAAIASGGVGMLIAQIFK